MVNGVVDENVLDNYIVMPVDDCSLDPFISLDVVGGRVLLISAYLCPSDSCARDLVKQYSAAVAQESSL